MQKPKIRLGSVPYLNAKVLVEGLKEDCDDYSLEFHPPSLLARKLKRGEVDVGLVSSVEFFRHSAYRILPGCSVSGLDSMWSIQLFHKRPLHALRKVALDPDSETTNAFLRIVLHCILKLPVELIPIGRDENPATMEALDGFLKIGDPCLRSSFPQFERLDLQYEWYRHTGKPFVYAVWLVRDKLDLCGLEQHLLNAKLAGLRNTDAIAERYHRQLGLDRTVALRYVSEIVRYELGESEQAGLQQFGAYLDHLGLIEQTRPLQFHPE